MAPITLRIKISADEAIAAGMDNAGEYTATVRPSELSDAQRRALTMAIETQPVATNVTRYPASGVAVSLPPVPLDSGGMQAWLDELAARMDAALSERGRRQREEETRDRAEIETWLGTPDTNLTHMDYRAGALRAITVTRSIPADLREAVDAKRSRLDMLVKTRNADAKAAADKVLAEKAAAELAARDRRDAQIAAWLKTAPETMRKRHARGLLPEADIIGAIRDEAYAPLDGLPRYERIDEAAVRRELNADEYDKVEFLTRDAESAHDEDIALIERIEAALPGAVCTLREHVGYMSSASNDDDPEVVRYSVRVALKVGELAFTREYAADR